MLKEFTVKMAKNVKDQQDPEARRLRRELFSDELVDELVSRAEERAWP